MSKPGHPFWTQVLEEIKSHSHGDPVDSTGPRMLERVITAYEYKKTEPPVWIAPPDLFYPKFDPGALGNLQNQCRGNTQWKETCDELVSRNWENGPRPGSLAIHHWAHTWLGAVNENESIEVSKVWQKCGAKCANVVPPPI